MRSRVALGWSVVIGRSFTSPLSLPIDQHPAPMSMETRRG